MSENKYVVFKLDKERFGLPIASVERILPLQNVTRLPKTPKMLLGVFELRGETIPALDARQRFGVSEDGEAHNFVVVLTAMGRCALKVDNVDGIFDFPLENVEPAEHIVTTGEDYLRGVGKQNDLLTLLLEPDHIVPKELRNKVAKVAA